MSCNDVKKLMYSRDDELSISERTALHNHLRKCATCQAERQAFLQEMAIVDSVKQPPALIDPGMLTGDIMRSIRAADKYSSKRQNPFDKMLDLFSLQPVRFVFAAGVLFICGFFLAQEMTVLNRLHQLEQRLAQHGAISTMSTMTSTTKDVLSLLDKKDATVVIDKELLEEFLKSYSELQMKNRLLLRMLQEQAEQANITWQDGLTEKELESLLKSETVQEKLREL